MPIHELVSPDKLLPIAQATAEELLAAMTILTKKSKNAIDGRLRLVRRKNGVHYFHVTKTSPDQGFYIPKSDAKTIKSLIQKDYGGDALKEVRRQISVVDNLVKFFHPERLDAIYNNLSSERRVFAEPLRLPDDVFTARWLSVKYEGKPFADDAPQLLTSRGDRVRSKSEVIIADTLARLDIPYRYEFPYQLKVCGRRTTFRPDFTCLNVATRREFIWEHFGLMDDPEYAASATKKFETYMFNGIFPGDGLLVTMETKDCPLNPKSVEKMAKRYLLH